MKSIKIAEQKDAAIIALLGRITFNQSFGHLFRDKQDLYNYLDETFSVFKIENSLQKANNIYWIAKYNDLPVGYAKLKINSPTEFIEIWLSVWKGNESAIRFYRRNSFGEVGNHWFQIGKENFEFMVMSKQL